ncbi:MAG: CsgG/HfaB family protein [Elusimicrobiota bacterium]
MRNVFVTIIFALIFFAAQPVDAGKQEKVRDLLSSAVTLYNSGDFLRALAEVDKAEKVWKNNVDIKYMRERISNTMKDQTAPGIQIEEQIITNTNPYTLSFFVADDFDLAYIMINDQKIEYTLSLNAQIIRSVDLTGGGGEFVIKTSDRKGNISSKTINIVLDKDAPGVVITKPEHLKTRVTEPEILVEGKISDANTLKLASYGDSSVRNVPPPCFFRKKVVLKPGENVIPVYAEDIAGNSTAVDLRITYYNPALTTAVADFDARSTDKTTAIAVSDWIRNALVKHNKFNIVDRSNMLKILNEQKFQDAVANTEDNAAKIGKLLNAQKMVVGNVMNLLGQVYINVSVINVESGIMEYSKKLKCSSPDDLFPGAEVIAADIVKMYVK